MATFTWSTPTITTYRAGQGGAYQRITGSVVMGTVGTPVAGYNSTDIGAKMVPGLMLGNVHFYVTSKATTEAVVFQVNAYPMTTSGTGVQTPIFSATTTATGTAAGKVDHLFNALGSTQNWIFPGTIMELGVSGVATNSSATLHYEIVGYSPVG